MKVELFFPSSRIRIVPEEQDHFAQLDPVPDMKGKPFTRGHPDPVQLGSHAGIQILDKVCLSFQENGGMASGYGRIVEKDVAILLAAEHRSFTGQGMETVLVAVFPGQENGRR